MAKRVRPILGVQRRYHWCTYPTPKQKALFHTQAHMCIDLWNALLELCEHRYASVGQRDTKYFFDKRGKIRHTFIGKFKSFHCGECATLTAEAGKTKLCEDHCMPSEYDIQDWITDLRDKCPEWKELSTWTPRQVVIAFTKAWNNFFTKGGGYPRYKSHRGKLSIPHRFKSGCGFRKSDRHKNSWWLYLAGVSDDTLWRRGKGRGDIWCRGQIPSEPHEWTSANIQLVDGKWLMSAAVDIEKRRVSARYTYPITVKFGLIGWFALVNEYYIHIDDINPSIVELDERRSELQSEFDKKWVRNKKYTDVEIRERDRERLIISKLAAKSARVRRAALHLWTKKVTSEASELTIITPSIKENTKTPHGNEREWGAAIAEVSALNRSVLLGAPSMAVQMLTYKAEELGIPVKIVKDENPEIATGRALVATLKTVRKAKHVLKKMG